MKETNYPLLEGIVLRSVAVQEGRYILTVFTPHEGLISLGTPRISIHEMRQNAAISLLSRSEFCMKKGRSEIHRLIEATQLESFDNLRDHFAKLSAAGDLLHSILLSQLSGKPAPLLYALLLTYLRRLTCSHAPALLVVSFQLKLLKHEGLFAWTKDIAHSIQEMTIFSPQDWLTVGVLMGSRSFSQIENLEASPHLLEQIKIVFEKLLL